MGVEVAVEQRLEGRDGGNGLGEAVPSVLAVLQGPVPHRGQRGVRGIGGGVHVSPAVDRSVGLSEVLGGVEYTFSTFLPSAADYIAMTLE